nr:replication protein A 70 kDa DNA-binding subunit B [Tanacetum cinerariifolium]
MWARRCRPVMSPGKQSLGDIVGADLKKRQVLVVVDDGVGNAVVVGLLCLVVVAEQRRHGLRCGGEQWPEGVVSVGVSIGLKPDRTDRTEDRNGPKPRTETGPTILRFGPVYVGPVRVGFGSAMLSPRENVIDCTFWDAWAERWNECAENREKKGHSVCILQLNVKPAVNNALFGSKLYINDDSPEIYAFSREESGGGGSWRMKTVFKFILI